MIAPVAVMINILGDRVGESQVKKLSKALQIKNVTVHIYRKQQTKIKRKMGHITAIEFTLKKAFTKASMARIFITI